MLIDSATIVVRSGKGGDGCVSFRREKYIPKGGPDGGDGGDGGSVVLRALPGVDTLLDFAGRHHWSAQDGQPGRGKQQHGRNGNDIVIDLPPGTQVYDEPTDELIVDLDTPGKQHVVAEGGKGGFGNAHFKSPTNQTPREATPGEPAVERTLRLELKLIADVGLVGLPNAGKSTLLSRISRARPKIADYPFTTLAAQLGIAELPGDRRLVVADIPGLIADAHRGAGLGTRFLRHIERTRLLVHVLDVQPADESDPVQNYRTVQRELADYSPALAQKQQVVALSKMDLLGDERQRQQAVRRVSDALGREVVPISSATGDGLRQLLEACWSRLQSAEPGQKPESGWRSGATEGPPPND